MTDTLFDLEDASIDPVTVLSAGARLTRRNNAAIAAGIHPATRQPLTDTTSRCARLRASSSAVATSITARTGNASKHVRGFTFGAASDIRVTWPDCALYQERTSA
jgi:hypothetical protein